MKTEDYTEGLRERLRDPRYAVDYLTDVLSDESPEAFLIALRDVIEARNEDMTALSQESGVTRQGLYQALSESGNPRLSTLTQVLGSIGFQLSIKRKKKAA